ncbi:probable membrane-associated kinase regulator 3 [Rosa rugosa]|uniref:probable membrane-associated kinase regulator 3 n=1 Tax=Rosa rugosa TaxID=74645 RepID=UPI002B40ED52|nr:probable membrane-associated kinase regulator 3 [Rosa rugosa]
MEMKVALPAPPVDFNFDSACSSPYLTAPSSPTRFGNYYFSAPTSPNRSSSFYRQFNDFDYNLSSTSTKYSPSSIPFKWEEKPGIPKSRATINGDDLEDFEFNFSGQLEKASLPADELFDGGKIKPLKPPPRLHVSTNRKQDPGSSSGISPRSPSPRSSRVLCQGKRMVQDVLSPRHLHRKVDSDPFTAAMEETRRDCYRDEYDYAEEEFQSRRGRERMSRMPSRHVNASIRKGTRSLSPLRIPDIMFDDVASPAPTASTSNSSIKPATPSSISSAYSSILSAISFSKVNKKWKLKDFLLFRSASEGRATTGKDPLRKYSLLSTKKSMSEDVKNSSFRSTDSVGSVSSRRRGPVSPHELHYTVNRAVTEEMRRKTVLPYKHGLLGCLGFNHGLHEISRGAFGSLARS